MVLARNRAALFVRWRNVSAVPFQLRVRPLLADEDADQLLHERALAHAQPTVNDGIVLTIDGLQPLHVSTSGNVTYSVSPCWYRDYHFAVDRARGYDSAADRYAPGVLTADLLPGEHIVVAFAAVTPERDAASGFDLALQTRTRRLEWAARGETTLAKRLRRGVDDFFYRDTHGRLGVLAGFPWFGEWGRDVFVSLPGLTLAVDEPRRCLEVLRGAVPFLRDGLLPNIYGPDKNHSHYGSADAALWFALCVQRLADASADQGAVRDEFGPVLRSIAESYVRGTELGLRVDGEGLLRAGSPDRNATWMDAQTSSGPVTPRAGQPVEIVALWCALRSQLGAWYGGTWQREAERAASAFVRRFWNERDQCLFDCRDGDRVDAAVRPNMVIAAALRLSPLTLAQRAAIVRRADSALRTPCGLRTLSADHPAYHGRYEGPTDERDAAYHQGTVWPWLSGFYVEAAFRAAPVDEQEAVRARMSAWLQGFVGELDRAGIDHVSEVYDGDAPQRPNGTFAQAWNTGELLRALQLCATGLLQPRPLSTGPNWGGA